MSEKVPLPTLASHSKELRQLTKKWTSGICINTKLHTMFVILNSVCNYWKLRWLRWACPSPTEILSMHLKHFRNISDLVAQTLPKLCAYVGVEKYFFLKFSHYHDILRGWAVLAPHATSCFILQNLHRRNCMSWSAVRDPVRDQRVTLQLQSWRP